MAQLKRCWAHKECANDHVLKGDAPVMFFCKDGSDPATPWDKDMDAAASPSTGHSRKPAMT
jgi:hypothetical protein